MGEALHVHELVQVATIVVAQRRARAVICRTKPRPSAAEQGKKQLSWQRTIVGLGAEDAARAVGRGEAPAFVAERPDPNSFLSFSKTQSKGSNRRNSFRVDYQMVTDGWLRSLLTILPIALMSDASFLSAAGTATS